jgi:hypothetical protein
MKLHKMKVPKNSKAGNEAINCFQLIEYETFQEGLKHNFFSLDAILLSGKQCEHSEKNWWHLLPNIYLLPTNCINFG